MVVQSKVMSKHTGGQSRLHARLATLCLVHAVVRARQMAHGVATRQLASVRTLISNFVFTILKLYSTMSAF